MEDLGWCTVTANGNVPLTYVEVKAYLDLNKLPYRYGNTLVSMSKAYTNYSYSRREDESPLFDNSFVTL